MHFEQINRTTKGFFKAVVEGKEAGRISYKWEECDGVEKMVVEHTDVNEEFKGQGIGKKLVMHVVEHARENKIKIVAVCEFAKSVFERVPEIRDVLFEDNKK